MVLNWLKDYVGDLLLDIGIYNNISIICFVICVKIILYVIFGFYMMLLLVVMLEFLNIEWWLCCCFDLIFGNWYGCIIILSNYLYFCSWLLIYEICIILYINCFFLELDLLMIEKFVYFVFGELIMLF